MPSPDGQHIATIFPANLTIRTTRSLEIIRVISLPPEFAAAVTWFFWSASSDRLLTASANEIRVYETTKSQALATITNPTSGTTKVSSVSFGATDNEVYVFSDFGLKVSIFNLTTSKSVEINSPKFYNSGVAARGTSHRPGTHNLAILTRSGGKDIISIHAQNTFEVIRSWHPDTIDAQGIAWSPDGRWIAVWESASQGHKMLIYTADGHMYKTWDGPVSISEEEIDPALGAGIKLFSWSPGSSHIALGDSSCRVTVLSAPSFTESLSLLHGTTLKPADTVQVQENPATHVNVC